MLDKADRLRRLRRYAPELSEAYLQAVFLEMFGDPVTNPRKWKTDTLRSASLIFSDGPFGSDLKTDHYTESGVRVIRLQNIGVGELIDEDKAFISGEHFKAISKHKCLPGDVIIGTLGDPNLRACMLPSSIPIALNKADCIQMPVNPEQTTKAFACWLLNLPHTLHLATGMIHGQTRERINMGRLAELEVPLPDIERQRQFSQVALRFERAHTQQREAQRQAEHLFQTLLHRAFEGEG